MGHKTRNVQVQMISISESCTYKVNNTKTFHELGSNYDQVSLEEIRYFFLSELYCNHLAMALPK